MEIKRILARIDFSDSSRAALLEADQLALERGASLTLLHVHAIVQAAFLDMTYTEPPEKLAESLTSLDGKLREWAALLKSPGSRVEVKVVMGAPVAEIINESESHDLLVISTHGRTGLSHFLMGSIAERVVRGARCAVLVIKSHRPRA